MDKPTIYFQSRFIFHEKQNKIRMTIKTIKSRGDKQLPVIKEKDEKGNNFPIRNKNPSNIWRKKYVRTVKWDNNNKYMIISVVIITLRRTISCIECK